MFSPPLAGLFFLFLFTFKSVAGLHNVTIQENDPRIRYSEASWTHITDLSDEPSLVGCSDGIMKNVVEGSFFEFNFTGTAVYLNTINGIKGTFQAILDEKPFDFDSENVTAAHCQIAYSQTGLTDGPHRLVILTIGSSSLLFDSITYTESNRYDYGNPTPGGIPKSKSAVPLAYVPVRPQAPRITASGTWQIFDLRPIGEGVGYCADIVFQTTTIGSSLELRFNGTAAAVNLFADTNSRGFITFSLDNKVEVMDGRSTIRGCNLAWNREGLSPEIEHVLRVTNTGPTNPDEPSLLSIASIRYTTTTDDPTVQDPDNTVPGLRALPGFIPYEDVQTDPLVFVGAIAAGGLIACFLGFVFYWARRDRLKQAARKSDEEKGIASKDPKDKNHKNKSTGLLLDDYQAPQRPKQSHVVVPAITDDTPRSSITLSKFPLDGGNDSRPSTQQSGRKVGFLDISNPHG